MDAIALHLELRNALSLSDELGRHEHALGNHTLSAQLAATRTVLASMEKDAGKTHSAQHRANPDTVDRLQRTLGVIRDRSEEIPTLLRPRVILLVEALERIVFAEQRPVEQVPAKPLFGVLPLARVVPQDVHTIADYLTAGAYFASAALARTKRGRATGILLGLAVGGTSAVTDYKLSLAKVISIELHELLDHASGSAGVTAPFVLGYVKKDPLASAVQIAAGLGAIALSLFTDYRAEKGIGRARRSRGGPAPRRDRLPKHVQNRVPEVQRPLEGLAGPSFFPEASTASAKEGPSRSPAR